MCAGWLSPHSGGGGRDNGCDGGWGGGGGGGGGCGGWLLPCWALEDAHPANTAVNAWPSVAKKVTAKAASDERARAARPIHDAVGKVSANMPRE